MGLRWSVLATVCAIAVVSSTPALAAENKAVQRYMTAAEELYEALEYERALEQLSRARALSKDPDMDVRIALLEGIILSDLGRASDADTAFRTALVLNPEAKLPLRVSPKVEQNFEATRKSVRASLASKNRNANPNANTGKTTAPTRSDETATQTASAAEDRRASATAESTTAAPAASVSASPPTEAHTGSPLRTVGWITAAAGGVALAGSGIFYVRAVGAHDALNPSDPITDTEARSLVEEGKSLQTWSAISGAVGLALVGTGIALVVVGGNDAEEPGDARLSLAPTGTGFVAVGTFR